MIHRYVDTLTILTSIIGLILLLVFWMTSWALRIWRLSKKTMIITWMKLMQTQTLFLWNFYPRLNNLVSYVLSWTISRSQKNYCIKKWNQYPSYYALSLLGTLPSISYMILLSGVSKSMKLSPCSTYQTFNQLLLIFFIMRQHLDITFTQLVVQEELDLMLNFHLTSFKYGSKFIYISLRDKMRQ